MQAPNEADLTEYGGLDQEWSVPGSASPRESYDLAERDLAVTEARITGVRQSFVQVTGACTAALSSSVRPIFSIERPEVPAGVKKSPAAASSSVRGHWRRPSNPTDLLP